MHAHAFRRLLTGRPRVARAIHFDQHVAYVRIDVSTQLVLDNCAIINKMIFCSVVLAIFADIGSHGVDLFWRNRWHHQILLLHFRQDGIVLTSKRSVTFEHLNVQARLLSSMWYLKLDLVAFLPIFPLLQESFDFRLTPLSLYLPLPF